MSDLFTLFAKLVLDSSEYDKGLDESKEKASTFGGGLKTAAKVGIGALAAIGTAAVGAGAALVKGVGGVAEYGDNIDKMAQKMGLSAEAYQEWDAVMQHSGTSMEAMKASMKTLANAAETNSKAFKELGITEDELKTLNQQELFERTISALQNVKDETKRTYLAGKTLGKGATELGALLNTSAEDTQAMRDRVRELGGVMSDDAVKAAAAYQDSLQDMQTAISGLKRGVMAEFLPAITTVMDGVTDLFAGDTEKGIEQLQDGIEQVFSTIDDAIPKVLETGEAIFTAIGAAVEANLPTIMEKGTQILVSLTEGVLEYAPKLLETLPEIITSMLTVIITESPRLISAGIQLLKALVTGVVNTIPALVAAVPQIFAAFKGVWDTLDWNQIGQDAITWIKGGINALATAIPNALKDIGNKAIEFFRTLDWAGLGQKVIDFIKNGVLAVPSLIANALVSLGGTAMSAFRSIDWFSLGSNVIQGIVNGLRAGMDWIADTARSVAKRALDAAKNFLGISSPSKVARDQIGKMFDAGLSLGLDSNAEEVADSSERLAKRTLAPFEGAKVPSVETPGVSYGGSNGAEIYAVLLAILAWLQDNDPDKKPPVPIYIDGAGLVGYYDRQMGLRTGMKARGVI